MKTLIELKTLIALFFILISSGLFAQEWAKVNPEMNVILADTTYMRSTMAVMEPGVKSGLHDHPAHFFYALTDCKLKVYYEDGQVQILDFKAGDAGYGAPEKPHRTENIGSETARFLLVELKEHPYRR